MTPDKPVDFYYDEATHSYYVAGKKVPSVTFLLAKHGITPSYARVDPQVLAYKAQRGTLVHKEIEDFVLDGVEGMTPECEYFINHIYPLCKSWLTEVRLFSEWYCGTCDLVGFPNDEEAWVVDTKTGHVDKNAVAWQTRMYARIMPMLEGKKVRYFVYDAKADGGKLIEVQPTPDTEIDKLLEAEKNGVLYTPTMLAIKEDTVAKLVDYEASIANLERNLKEMKDLREAVYKELKSEFEKQGVTEYESANLKIAYVKPYKRDGFDTKAFAKDEPALYEKYYKPTNVSASLRVTLKEVSA